MAPPVSGEGDRLLMEQASIAILLHQVQGRQESEKDLKVSFRC